VKLLKIEVDRKSTEALERAIRLMPQRVSQVMGPRMRKAMSAVQTQARQKHEFTSQTGALVRSIDARVRDKGLTGEVMLRNEIAEYGKYIHEGFQSWAPDPFLDDAFKGNLQLIEQQITLGLQQVIDELFK